MHGLGRDQITLGSAADSDVVLQGAGVAPHHARIVKRDGILVFVDLGAGPTTANGAPVSPGDSVPFDFRTQFVVGPAVTSSSDARRSASPGSSRIRPSARSTRR